MTYYSVKLNVPHDKADAIRALVPEGEPVSGTLIAILLDVAAARGIEVSEHSDTPDRELSRIAKRLTRVEARLDAALAHVLGGGSR